ncbi:MarR family transcriptional regulator [Mycobacterium sp. IS-1742]|uniref:MarR family winged helix-turn-helix transcriptional regulator n=1 Tax=Mycobacterium sp. IS-1742 TaxID=1772285 RepID=UPI000740160F|nr:MarR family transcriptional regulator [Mycobacterium sp. IS-1742]KUI30851.1 MarR family transcriptional regulator [Mycobacterium sp. IS-1742]
MAETPSVTTLMFVAHRAAETRIFDALRAAGFDDLTLAQSRIGQRLRPDGIRLTDLAEEARVTKQTAGALVDQLERAGYVVRTPDPTDARARLVMLSDRGRRLCAAAASELAVVEREWRSHLGAETFDRLHEAMVSLREITDPYR